jgi:type I restriction enzyme, S subunit
VIPLAKIADILSQKITGEWGDEPHGGRSIKVLRTTNFTNEGRLNLTSVVERAIDDLIVERKKLKYGDTIIEKSGGSPNQPVGRVVFFDMRDGQKYLCNNFTAILRPRDDVFPKYFFYTLFYNHLKKATLRFQNKTTGILNLQLERYLQEEIPIPSLPVQKQIATILDKADAARQKRREANQLTEQFLQSTFLDMFGDPVTNPKGWEITTIANVVARDKHSIIRGPFGGAIKKEIFVPHGYKVYEQKNAIKNDFQIGSYFIDGNKYKEMKAFVVQPADLIISCSGTIGRVAVVPVSASLGIINQALMKLTLDPMKALPIFAKFMLETDHVQRLLFGTAGGSAIKNVKPLKEIRQKELPIPPLTHQRKFAALVEKVESLRAKQRESEKELENLFNSLMQRAFRGELVG